MRKLSGFFSIINLNKYFTYIFLYILYLTTYMWNDPSFLGYKIDYYDFIHPSIITFADNNLIYALKNYNAAMNPLHFIFYSYIGAFVEYDLSLMRIVSISTTFLILVIMYKIFMRLFLEKYIAFCLLIPFVFSFNLRGSSFWLNTDSLPLFFISLSFLIFLYSTKIELKRYKVYISIILIYFLSFLAFYTRQLYLWYVLFTFIMCVRYYRSHNYLILQFILIFVFFIPQILLYLLWGGFINPNFSHHFAKEFDMTSVSLTNAYFVFYFTPLLFIVNFKHLGLNSKNIFDNKFKYFLSAALVISIILAKMFNIERLSVSGGGMLVRLLYFISESNIIYFVIFIFNIIFISIIYLLLKSSVTKIAILTMIFFLLPLYTSFVIMPKYFDPVIYFLLFILLEKIIKKGKSIYWGGIAVLFFQIGNYLLIIIWILFYKK